MKQTKVLYVEDEIFLAKIVKESLESRNFEVMQIAEGKKVIQAFNEFQPDICVLDVMLPDKDGFMLAEEIRQTDASIPIIFLTAKIQTEDTLKGFQVGGNDYLKKPFSLEELIVRINNLLSLTQRKVQNAGENASIGRYEFLPQRYELRYGDNVRKLSHRETELLTILSENRNFTVTRKEILMKIWKDDSFFNSRNLDVYITKLRDYFKEDESVQLMTIKGIGYRFLIAD
jgi:DNA-binding response OmpR family regulator